MPPGAYERLGHHLELGHLPLPSSSWLSPPFLTPVRAQEELVLGARQTLAFPQQLTPSLLSHLRGAGQQAGGGD